MEMSEGERQKYFDYLEELRESGRTNMFGAGPYLEVKFGLTRREAKTVLMAWMESYE